MSRLQRLDAGHLLVIDDDATGPHREPEPQTLATISVGNLASLASRLEVRARAIAGEQPESAADVLMAARFTRHGVKTGWVTPAQRSRDGAATTGGRGLRVPGGLDTVSPAAPPPVRRRRRSWCRR
ncbi:MAG: hypothetical protein FWD12_16455 [Alphaproteobacteria bacterium]|nr:hypothetical protein [Alphaproteobacteria bacterium]